MNKRSSKKLIVITLLILIVMIFLYTQNNDITITRMKITSSKIPEDFSGYKILQISDLQDRKSVV